MAVSSRQQSPAQKALSVSPVSHALDRVEVKFDDPNLVANEPAWVWWRLGLLDLSGRGA